jgi:hypothetical protein
MSLCFYGPWPLLYTLWCVETRRMYQAQNNITPIETKELVLIYLVLKLTENFNVEKVFTQNYIAITR